MIDIKLKYQAVAFINAPEIIANQTNITNMMAKFSDKELLPSTFQEFGPLLPPTQRIKLNSPNNEWEIRIGSTRIDFEKNPIVNKGANLGELNDFCAEASNAFERVLDLFPKKANRLALVTRYFLKEMSDEQLKKTYVKLFKAPKTYSENIPFEWNWRSVAGISKEISETPEDINFITALSRVTSQLREDVNIIQLDRIDLNFDINTSNHKTELRFGKAETTSFFKDVVLWHDSLLEEITTFIS